MSKNGVSNIASGFKKTGIFPLNSAPVLARLPRRMSQEMQQKDVHQASASVSVAVTDMLSTLRSDDAENDGAPPKKRKRRSKVQVAPGKSVTSADMPESRESSEEPSTSSEGHKGCSKAAAHGNLAKKCQRKLVVEEESGESASELSDGVSVEEDLSSSDEGSDGGPLLEKADIQQGDWIVVQFATKRTVKYFIGTVTEVLHRDKDGDFQVDFLRKTTCSDVHFCWPSTREMSYVDFEQVLTKLQWILGGEMVKFNTDLSNFCFE